jgi:hypothetical protein
MTSYAFLVQELQQVGDTWEIVVNGIGDPGMLALRMWPPSGLTPYGVWIREGIVITEPDVQGSFTIGGLTGEAFQSMDEGFAALFREQGFDPDRPAPGNQRVTNSEGVTWEMDDAEFTDRFVDHFVYFEIQPDIIDLYAIDDETLTVRLANGLDHRVRLGLVGAGPLVGSQWLIMDDGVIVPATPYERLPVYDQVNCPRLNELRWQIHIVIDRAAKERLMLAYIVAAFAQVGTIASGGGDPGLADKVLDMAREAQRLHGELHDDG